MRASTPHLIQFLICSIVLPPLLVAQNINGGISSVYDPNIFNVNTPQSDQVTQLQLGVGKEWDIDNETLELSYNGGLLLFTMLPSRTYHLHQLTLNSNYQFYRDDDEGDSPADSSGGDTTGSQFARQPVAHADSADRFLTTIVEAFTQVDKTEFNQFDNTKISGSLIYREPLGLIGSIRPSYTFSYHSYPNISGISNTEHLFGGSLGIGSLPRAWTMVSLSYGIKKYSTATYEYTFVRIKPGKGGHGKGGAGGGSIEQTSTIDLTTPSVNQLVLTGNILDSVASATRVTMQASYFAQPSTEARILPEQISGVLEREGIGTGTNAEDEIFDDHYGYSGGLGIFSIRQNLPFSIALGIELRYQDKNYTIPAAEFDSTIATNENRHDRRVEGIITLARPIPISALQSLTIEGVIGYLHNTSNVSYYEFEKTTISAGIEFAF